MTATAVDERTLLPGPTRPPSGPTTSFPLTNRRVVLADDPCEAGLSGADSEYAGIYLHARYFDPKLGTFLSPDPIGVAGGMNEYAYGFGDPVNGADRRGLLKDQCDEGDTSCRRYSEDITVTGYISSLLQVFLNVLWYNPAIPSSQPTTSDPTAGGGTTTCTGPNCQKEEPKKEEPPVVTPPPAPGPTPKPRDRKQNQEFFRQFQQRVCSASGYADLNVGRNFIPLVKPVLFGGPTGGVQLANTGKVYVYGGASVGSPGYGSGFTLSPHTTGAGYTAAIQVSIPPGTFQFGFGPFESASTFLNPSALWQGRFWEIGVGAPAGVTGQLMHSWEVFDLWNCS